MSRYADPARCPDCRAPLPAPPAPRTACPACGLPLEGAAAVELFTTLQRADTLVATLRATASAAAPAAAPVAAPVAATVATPAAGPTATPGPPRYASTPAAPVVPPLRPATPGPGHRWTVPAVLLSLGGLCLVVGALVFLAVTWSVLGVGGRTAVLVGLTAVAATGTVLTARRGLRGGAETFAAVACLFLALDLAGAGAAGWLGDADTATLVLAGALVVTLAPTLGNLALRRLPTGPLLAPQLVAIGAAATAAVAALVRFDAHPTVVTSVAVVATAGLAAAARRLGQPALSVGSMVVSVLLWALLVMSGLAGSLDAWAEHGRGGATWQDVEPLVVAAGFAVAVLVVSRLLGSAPVVQQLAVVVACWLVPTAVAAVVGESVTAVVLVAVVGTAAIVPLVLVLRPLTAAVGVAALGVAAAAVLGAATAVVVLVSGVAEEVARQVTADPHDLLARADLADLDADVAAPWTLPFAALALAAALLVLAPSLRTRLRGRRPVLALGLPVLAATVLCYAPVLLLVVVTCVVLAGLHLLPQLRPWRREADVALAAGWAALAGLVSFYDPLPATAVALLVTVVVTVHVVRTGSQVAQLVLPPLVATTVATAGWLVGAPTEWTVAALVVAVAVMAVAIRSDLAIQLSALATCLVSLPVGVGAADPHAAAWLAAYLTLVAAGAAAIAIKDRSRGAAWVSALLELGAVWVRLGASGVDTPEAYTLPLAAVLLAFGGWTLWHRRDAGTTWTLGPGLGVAMLPSLVLAATDPVSLRALLLAIACGALVALGAVRRLRAPLVAGALVGAALVVVEVVPFHDAVPRWVLLTAAGIVLVVAGVRWEHLAALGRRGWGRLHELT